jgi:hypothetical protein
MIDSGRHRRRLLGTPAWALTLERVSAIHVKKETKSQLRPLTSYFSPGMFVRTAMVFLLLVAVAGLSTIAKDSQYFPRTDPVRHASLSTKMKVAHAPVVISGDKLQPIARVVPPLRAVRVTRLEQFETAPLLRISVAVSMQHRSPPFSLA